MRGEQVGIQFVPYDKIHNSKRIPDMAQVAEQTRKAKGSVVIAAERCKGCGFCVEFCPPEVLELSTEYNSKGYHTPILAKRDQCTGCDICGMVCPDFAIYGYMIKKKTKEA